ARIRSFFDLDARPDVIARHLGSDRYLSGCLARNAGLRVPGAFGGFELALRTVLGQQVSVCAATTLAGRFAEAFGEPIATPFATLCRLSPTPTRIAEAQREELTRLGLVAARAECVRALAQGVCDKRVNLEAGPDPEACMQRLQSLPGIGPWSAHYIAMR